MWRSWMNPEFDLVRNAWRLTAWRLRKYLGFSAQWPVIWSKPKLKTFPTQSLRNTLSAVERNKLDAIVREIQLLSQCYSYFPQTLTDHDWIRLLKCHDQRQRLNHIKFCRVNEVKRRKVEMKKQSKVVNDPTNDDTDRPSRPPFLLLHETQKRILKERQTMRYIQSQMLNLTPSLIIDSRFLKNLSPQALSQTMYQFNLLIAQNIDRLRPWPLYFSNYDSNDEIIMIEEKRYLGTLYSKRCDNPVMSSSSHLDFFPRSSLVYLSPHAENDLEKVDGSKAYILGGIVDRVHQRCLHPQATVQAAREDNIEVFRLPLDRYVKWKSGTRSLTLTAVSAILNEVYENGGDWRTALNKYIPVRNVRGPEEKNAYGRLLHSQIVDYHRRLLHELNQRSAEGKDVMQAVS